MFQNILIDMVSKGMAHFKTEPVNAGVSYMDSYTTDYINPEQVFSLYNQNSDGNQLEDEGVSDEDERVSGEEQVDESAAKNKSKAQKAPKKQSFTFSDCNICNDKATGVHYGISTCEGCKVS